jgi:anti-sigma factor RsiW
MSCSPIHLNDYLLKELADPERRKLELHLKSCAVCREELERLRLTQNALFSLRDEEIPQRIAFVSDPVFEASPWRKWWGGFWSTPARLGFVSAAMLSGAILFSAATRPAPVAGPIRVVTAPAAIQTAAAVSDAEIERRVQAAVEKVMGAKQDSEAARIHELINELDQARQQLKVASAELDFSQRRANDVRYVAGGYGPPAQPAVGGLK